MIDERIYQAIPDVITASIEVEISMQINIKYYSNEAVD